MAEVKPLRALHYDSAVAGPLQELVAPPYDVIDPPLRAELAARSPYNVVRIDLPEGEDPYAQAAATLAQWEQAGAVVRDPEEAYWALREDYTGPDGELRTRGGLFCRVRVEEYGPGRIRPHERTHPGPKQDRLSLTRATKANLSPIFSLYPDPSGEARAALEEAMSAEPFGEATDADGTRHRLWRAAEAALVERIGRALDGSELLIADGHHRYETARAYADEIGGEGDHRYVLMCLVALEDPGLTVFPTHRLLHDTTPESQERLGTALKASFEVSQVELSELAPEGEGELPVYGYMDSHARTPWRLELSDTARVDELLAGRSEAYRRLDTAVLEALVLRETLGMSDDDIDHLRGLSYSKSTPDAIDQIESGRADAGFLLRPTPIERVRAVAEAGETMPPKSTYFFPKVLSGMLFNPLA